MASLVARFLSSAALPVDLSDEHIPHVGSLAREARQRIASALGQPYNRIRLVDPLICEAYDDGEKLEADVQVVVLKCAPVADAAAELGSNQLES